MSQKRAEQPHNRKYSRSPAQVISLCSESRQEDSVLSSSEAPSCPCASGEDVGSEVVMLMAYRSSATPGCSFTLILEGCSTGWERLSMCWVKADAVKGPIQEGLPHLFNTSFSSLIPLP